MSVADIRRDLARDFCVAIMGDAVAMQAILQTSNTARPVEKLVAIAGVAQADALLDLLAANKRVPPSQFDWTNAPEWARFGATDSDGKSHWFDIRPVADTSGDWVFPGFEGNFVFSHSGEARDDWRDSLEARPQA